MKEVVVFEDITLRDIRRVAAQFEFTLWPG
jgi:hypothetical protein